MSSSNSAFNTAGAITPNQKVINPLTLGASMSSGNPLTRVLDSMKTGGVTTPQIQLPSAPTNQQITSHTVSPDGTVKQTYATGTGTKAAASSQPSSPGSYKGVLINPGSDADIQAQMAKIDAGPTTTANAGTTGATSTQGVGLTSGALNNAGATAPVTPPAPPQSTYSGFLGGLKSAATDTSAVDKANLDLENLRKGYAAATGNIENPGSYLPMQFVQGREQVLNKQFASQEAAAESALSNALEARGQTISGLGTAASLAQPIQAPYNNQVLDPTTGLPVNPQAGASMQDAVNLQAQKVRNGTASPQDAANALSAYGQAGTNALQQALGTSFNIPQAEGQAAAQQANAQTGGTAFVNANQQIYAQALSDFADVQKQLANVDQLGSLLLSVAQSGGINPSASQFANKSIAEIRAQLSNPYQASFDSNMVSLSNQIAKLLNVGGGAVTDQVRNEANAILSGTLALSALPTVLNQIAREGNTIIGNQRTLTTNAYNNLTQGAPSSTSGSTGGGTVQAGGYSFVKDASGKWIPAK